MNSAIFQRDGWSPAVVEALLIWLAEANGGQYEPRAPERAFGQWAFTVPVD